MNEEEEFYEESKDQWTSEKFEAENPLFAELEKMELERDELQGKNKKKGKSGMKIEQDYEKRPMKSLAKKLTVPEWMISPPSNLNKDYWFVYIKPDGQRCLIISSNGKTIRRNKNGFYESTFMSQLPGGSPSSDKENYCMLDCIYNEQLKVFFIMDVIIWNGVRMNLNFTESRFFMIENNILSENAIQEIGEDNDYIFASPKKYDCTVENFLALYRENTPYMKDGLLFAHKEAPYIEGSNSFLLLWKDVFTSLYAIETNGTSKCHEVQCVLQLTEDYELQTLDEVVLTRLETDDFDPPLKPGNLVRVSVESLSFNEKADNIGENVIFHGIKVIQKSSYKRATADNISKIIFQYLIRNYPVTADHIVKGIKDANEIEMGE